MNNITAINRSRVEKMRYIKNETIRVVNAGFG